MSDLIQFIRVLVCMGAKLYPALAGFRGVGGGKAQAKILVAELLNFFLRILEPILLMEEMRRSPARMVLKPCK